jgi:hypothetical protein
MPSFCSTCACDIPEDRQICPRCEAAAVTPAPAPPLFSTTLATQDLEGLSGWLVLVGLGLVVSPFIMLSTVLRANIPFLYAAKYQPFLTSHRALAALIVFELITNIVFLASVLALNYLFFTKRSSFPTYMILYLATHFGIIVLDTVAAHALLPSANLASGYTAVAQSFGGIAIWIPYLLVSRRVKATFVR